METTSNSVCCLCIKFYTILEGTYETDENNVRHYEKLKICFPNELWYKDYRICKNCIEDLHLAHKFICICIKNEKARKQIYGKHTGPFSCNDCSKSYKSELVLKKHVTLVHAAVLIDGPPHNNVNTNDISKTVETKEEKLSIVVEVVAKKEDDTSIFQETVSEEKKLTVKKVVRKRQDDTISISEETLNESNQWEDDENSKDVLGNVIKKENSTLSSKQQIKQPQKKLKRLSKIVLQNANFNKVGQWKCEECGIVFKQEKYLKKHIWSKHKFQGTFKCDQCDSSYKYRNSLEIHKRVHTGERPFVCSFCGKGFRSGQELNVHVKTHQPENNYPCPFCDKAFKTAGNLRKHKICVHTDSEEYKYKCSQCGHKFPFKGHLDLHLKRHAGIKKLPCHVCGKNFLLKSDVDFHIRRTHKNEQLANCEVCNKEFKTTHGLRKHLKSAHNMGNYKGSLVQVKKLLCPYCPKMFPYSSKLQRHILIHTGEKPFKCDICAKGFRDTTDLKTHLKNAHPFRSEFSG